MGRNPRILKSGRHDADFYKTMWSSMAFQGSWSGEVCNRRADGTEYNVLSNVNAVRESDGKVLYYFAVQTDVTLLHQTQLRLAHQASYDALTELPLSLIHI